MKRTIGNCMVALIIGAGAALSIGACQRSGSSRTSGELHVDVTGKGFEPAEVKVPAGQAFTLVMTRKIDQTCATEVVFEGIDRRYRLPLNQPVRISLPARPAGILSYQCGMKMLGGRIVVQ